MGPWQRSVLTGNAHDRRSGLCMCCPNGPFLGAIGDQAPDGGDYVSLMVVRVVMRSPAGGDPGAL